MTPAKRAKGSPGAEDVDTTLEQLRQAMAPVKRVFNINVPVCPKCGAEARVIASIKDQPIIDKILAHLKKNRPERGRKVRKAV